MQVHTSSEPQGKAKSARFIIPTLFILALAIGFSMLRTQIAAQTATALRDQVKIVRVNAATIARLPKSRTYMIDLTAKNVVYDLNNAGSQIDLNRIVVRTATGEESLTSWHRRQFPQRQEQQSARLVMGTNEGIMKVLNWKPKSGPDTEYHCPTKGGPGCGCSGLNDCTDMLSSGWCVGGTAACEYDKKNSPTCTCTGKGNQL